MSIFTFLGHNTLRLIAFDEDEGVRFKIQREGIDANNLSEGECSLLSFCYFVAKIQDELQDEINRNKLIIYLMIQCPVWIVIILFFMFSLIEAVIAKPENMLSCLFPLII